MTCSWLIISFQRDNRPRTQLLWKKRMYLVQSSKMDLRWKRVLRRKMWFVFHFQTDSSSPGGGEKLTKNQEPFVSSKEAFLVYLFIVMQKRVFISQIKQWIILSHWVFVMLHSPTSWEADTVDWNGFSELNVAGRMEGKIIGLLSGLLQKFRLRGQKNGKFFLT